MPVETGGEPPEELDEPDELDDPEAPDELVDPDEPDVPDELDDPEVPDELVDPDDPDVLDELDDPETPDELVDPDDPDAPDEAAFEPLSVEYPDGPLPPHAATTAAHRVASSNSLAELVPWWRRVIAVAWPNVAYVMDLGRGDRGPGRYHCHRWQTICRPPTTSAISDTRRDSRPMGEAVDQIGRAG